MTFTFYLFAEPVAKGRPRFSTQGGYPRSYTPQKTRDNERELRLLLKAEWHRKPLEGPLAVKIIFYCPIPKSTSKKRSRAMMGAPVIKKIDIDNLCKQIFDSANQILFLDDSQIWKIEASKVYSETPKIYLEITSEEV